MEALVRCRTAGPSSRRRQRRPDRIQSAARRPRGLLVGVCGGVRPSAILWERRSLWHQRSYRLAPARASSLIDGLKLHREYIIEAAEPNEVPRKRSTFFRHAVPAALRPSSMPPRRRPNAARTRSNMPFPNEKLLFPELSLVLR